MTNEVDKDLIRHPWWLRAILVVSSKEGVERLIALVFIVSVVFVGYRIMLLLDKIGNRHMQFIDIQTQLSIQNANTLSQSVETLKGISAVGDRIEQALDNARADALQEHKLRSQEHKMLLEEIKRK